MSYESIAQSYSVDMGEVHHPSLKNNLTKMYAFRASRYFASPHIVITDTYPHMSIIRIWIHIMRIYVKVHQTNSLKSGWEYYRHIISCVDTYSSNISSSTRSYIWHAIFYDTFSYLSNKVFIIEGLQKSKGIATSCGKVRHNKTRYKAK